MLRKHRRQLRNRALNSLLWVLWITFMYACVSAASDKLFHFMQKHVSDLVLGASHTRTRQFGNFYDVLT